MCIYHIMQNLIDVCFRRAGVLGVLLLDDYYIGLFSSDFAVFATFWVVFKGFCGLKSSERFTFSFQNLVRFLVIQSCSFADSIT